METNEVSKSCKRYWIRSFKLIVAPITRLRKILRKTNMRQMKIAVGVLIVFSCVATVISYYWYRLTFNAHRLNGKDLQTTEETIAGTPMKHVPLNEVYKDIKLIKEDDDMFERQAVEVYSIDTPGCKIPEKPVNYMTSIKNDTRRKVKCGKRAVFLRKLDGITVIALIKTHIIQKYMKLKENDFYCCYQFLLDIVSSSLQGNRNKVYSRCTKFEDNTKITLQTDFINIKCFEQTHKNETFSIYEDMFAFAKKLNVSLPKKSKCKIRYNVIMLGMDSMSQFRVLQTLPRTSNYFKNDYWINYRGYNKIADNTFPNLMAAFTGMNLTSIEEKCSGKMDDCNHFMIWNAFKEAGYVTAYGEDYLHLPDTFTNEYEFKKSPTDHYMRPFFINVEYRRKNSTFLCAGKVCSGQQILDYALDFAHTYRKELFFGIFWINSFSHDAKSRPHEADKMLENFFFQLTYTGVLENTFVIFFSDHGIRFGEPRFQLPAYYDDRLPMLFIWPPPAFKRTYPLKLRALVANQIRLVTPYDIYSTLLDIKDLSKCNNVTGGPSEGCVNCHSIFKFVNVSRTCQDVPIGDKWCSCHKMYPLPVQDTEGTKSVQVVVNHIKSMINSIKTERCWGCMSLSLKSIYRIHFYYDKDKISLFYVVAFSMAPGNTSYEATVLRKSYETHGNIVGPVSVISNYRGLGKCAVHHRDRLYCVCQKKESC